GVAPGAFESSTLLVSDADDVLRLRTLRALLDLELDLLTLVERLVPLGVDRGIMDENVRAVLARDESVTLAVVEPLHFSLGHDRNLLASFRSSRRNCGTPSRGAPGAAAASLRANEKRTTGADQSCTRWSFSSRTEPMLRGTIEQSSSCPPSAQG